MSVVSVQCPNCGAPLQEARPGSLAQCASCGSMLEIRSGASGYPLAVLASISADTSLLARREAVAVLKERAAALRAKREQTAGMLSITQPPAKNNAWNNALLIGGALAAITWYVTGMDSLVWPLLILALALVAAALDTSAQNRRRREQETRRIAALDSELRTLDAQIADCRRQIDTLQREIDAAVDQLAGRPRG